MNKDLIFTKAFFSKFKPLKFYYITYGKNGPEINKEGKGTQFLSKGYQASTGTVKNTQKTPLKAKIKKRTGSTTTKVKEKTMEAYIRGHKITGKDLRIMRKRKSNAGRSLHKEVHLQPDMAVRKDKHTRARSKVQHISTRKPSRVPKVHGKRVRRRNSRKHGKKL